MSIEPRNHYRDELEEERKPDGIFSEEITVFLVWDDGDYYGPDAAADPWIFTSREAAEARLRTLGPNHHHYIQEVGAFSYRSLR